MHLKIYSVISLIFTLGLSANGQSCSQDLVFGDACAPNYGFSCPTGYICNVTCSCPYTHYYDGTSCIPKKFDGANCTSDGECQGYLNPPVKCVNLKCACPSTHMPSGNICIPKKQYQESCDCSSQCDKSKRLLCLNSNGARTCDCIAGFYWNGQICTPRKTIEEACSSTTECAIESKLVCTNGLCVCPQGLTWQDVTNTGQYTCACVAGYYGSNCECHLNPCQLGASDARPYVGDFNGDGRSDVFCVDGPGNVYVLASTVSGLQSTVTDKSGLVTNEWCKSPNVFEVRDFNGDGKADIICKTSTSHVILLSNGTTFVPPLNYTFPSGYCTTGTLYWEDFNGDGRLDLFCHDRSRLMISVLLTNQNLVLASPNSNSSGAIRYGWCYATGQIFFLGDFNNDNKLDLLCYANTNVAYVLVSNGVSLSSPSTDNNGYLGKYCNYQTDNVYFKDYNGDGRVDMICQNNQTGSISVALSTGTTFNSPVTISQSYCHFFPDRIPMQMVDFDNNKGQEFICNDNLSGQNWYLTYGSNGPVYPTGSAKSSYTASCDQYLYGDYNGDSIKDMICYRKANLPHLSVYLLTSTTASNSTISLDSLGGSCSIL